MDPDSLILAGYDPDAMGYDEDEVGFPNPFAAVRRAFGGGGRPRRPAPRPAVAPARRAAVSRAEALRDYQPDSSGHALDQLMPFETGQFTASVSTLTLRGQPQRAFQLRRLVIVEGRIGTTSTALVGVTQLTVGADPQFVNTGTVPASMFSPTAVGTALKPAAARPGIILTLQLNLTGTALAGTDVINIQAAASGPSIG